MKRLICLSMIVLVVSVAAFADIARPEPAKTPKAKPDGSIVTQMDIRLDSDATEARLEIPKAKIKQLRAQLDELDDANDNTAAVTSPGSFSRTQTVVSGMFLSLAVVFGGMWFVRSGKAATKTAKTFVVLVTVAAIASAATFVYANAGPPSAARSITGKMFSDAVHMYGFGWGDVRLTTTSDDRIRLVVPDPKPATTPSSK
jgi:hypothetical protein